jgi:hypothetical protein
MCVYIYIYVLSWHKLNKCFEHLAEIFFFFLVVVLEFELRASHPQVLYHLNHTSNPKVKSFRLFFR